MSSKFIPKARQSKYTAENQGDLVLQKIESSMVMWPDKEKGPYIISGTEAKWLEEHGVKSAEDLADYAIKRQKDREKNK